MSVIVGKSAISQASKIMTSIERLNHTAFGTLASAKLAGITSVVFLFMGYRGVCGALLFCALMCLIATVVICYKGMSLANKSST